jgi:hypothetical protein
MRMFEVAADLDGNTIVKQEMEQWSQRHTYSKHSIFVYCPTRKETNGTLHYSGL